MPTRSWASAVRITDQPPPTSPSTASGPAGTSSKKTSLRWCGPSIERMGRTVMPGASIGTSSIVMPSWRVPGPTRAARMHQSAMSGVRGPDLLARDAPAVAVGLGTCAQRREVRPRLGLGEPLAPDDPAGRDGAAGDWSFCCLGAVRHDRRADPVEAHVLRAAGLVVRPHLLADHRLVPHRSAASAVALRARRRSADPPRRGSRRTAGSRPGRRGRR